MRIEKIRTGIVRIPLRTPFKTALRTVDAMENVLVEIETDEGVRGYGEAPPTAVITGDTLGSIQEAVNRYLAPAIVGLKVSQLDIIMERLKGCIQKNTSALAAVDMAVYDLYAKDLGRPLYQVLGGSKKELQTDITISVNPIQEMVADSLKAVERGFSILKVKVGKEGTKDIERIAEIRKAVGNQVKIRVDANQGWSSKEAVKIIRTMEDQGLDVELVEQPVKAHDRQGMKYVTANTGTTILADESVFSAKDAIWLLENQAADMINIKLMKTGGIHEALKICSLAEIYGVKCMMGCMLESKVAVSAAAHVAAAKNVITTVDLDGPSLCLEDPYTGGPIYRDAAIFMAENAGIGITEVPDVFGRNHGE